MSFLNQLKSQASAVKQQAVQTATQLQYNLQETEQACKTVWWYLDELAKQLNVLEPASAPLSLDGRSLWPDMKLTDFRVDARKKLLRDKEVYDYLVIGWRILPRHGKPKDAFVSANFPPSLARIEQRLAAGAIQHERVNVRYPDSGAVKEIRFDHTTEARASVMIHPKHDSSTLNFRLACVLPLQVVEVSYPSSEVNTALMDELSKLLVGQTSAFKTSP